MLPFVNLSGEPEHDNFVDGLVESLTTDLSRISNMFARNSALSYKGKDIDVRQVGRELNVRYVLVGSVQRNGSRLRMNVQLIDAESGKHLWVERFEKPIADLFDMQDEIVSRLAYTLHVQLVIAAARRAERLVHPDAKVAAALGLLGALNEARAAARAGLALNPGFTIRRLLAAKSSENPTFLAGQERACEGMRIAEVPEG